MEHSFLKSGCGLWKGDGFCMWILLWFTRLRGYLADVTQHQVHVNVPLTLFCCGKQSFQHMAFEGVGGGRVCYVKQFYMKRSLLTIVEECVCVCETGADVTCRVTQPDTTAVCQTGERERGGVYVCVLCDENNDEAGQLE